MTDATLPAKAPAYAIDDKEGMSYLDTLPRRVVTVYLPLFIILVVLLVLGGGGFFYRRRV